MSSQERSSGPTSKDKTVSVCTPNPTGAHSLVASPWGPLPQPSGNGPWMGQMPYYPPYPPQPWMTHNHDCQPSMKNDNEITVDSMRRIYNDKDSSIEIERVKFLRKQTPGYPNYPPMGQFQRFIPGTCPENSNALLPFSTERRPPPRRNRKNKLNNEIAIPQNPTMPSYPYPHMGYFPYYPPYPMSCYPYPWYPPVQWNTDTNEPQLSSNNTNQFANQKPPEPLPVKHFKPPQNRSLQPNRTPPPNRSLPPIPLPAKSFEKPKQPKSTENIEKHSNSLKTEPAKPVVSNIVTLEGDSPAPKAPARRNKTKRMENKDDLKGETDLKIGTDLKNETDLQIETDLKNETDLQIETDLKNETDLQIETDLKNETDLQIETDLKNDTDRKNKTNLGNETEYKNVTDLKNERVTDYLDYQLSKLEKNVHTYKNEVEKKITDCLNEKALILLPSTITELEKTKDVEVDSSNTSYHSVSEAPLEDRPLVDRPLEDRHLEDRPLVDRHLEDRHLEDRHLEDKPLEDRPLVDRPLEERHLQDRHLEDRHLEDKPLEDRPLEDTPLEDTPLEDTPVEDKPLEDRPLEDAEVTEIAAETVRIEEVKEDVPILTWNRESAVISPRTVQEDLDSFPDENTFWILQKKEEAFDVTQQQGPIVWLNEVSLLRSQLVVSLDRGLGLDTQDWVTFNSLIQHPLPLQWKLSLLHAPRICAANSNVGVVQVRAALLQIARHAQILLQEEKERASEWRTITIHDGQPWITVKGGREILRHLGYRERDEGMLTYSHETCLDITHLGRLTLDLLVFADELRLYLTGQHPIPTSVSDLFCPMSMSNPVSPEPTIALRHYNNETNMSCSSDFLSAETTPVLQRKSAKIYDTSASTDREETSKVDYNKQLLDHRSSSEDITLHENDNKIEWVPGEDETHSETISMSTDIMSLPDLQSLSSFTPSLSQSSSIIAASETASKIEEKDNQLNQDKSNTSTPDPVKENASHLPLKKKEDHIYEEIGEVKRNVQKLRSSVSVPNFPPPLPPKYRPTTIDDDPSIDYSKCNWSTTSMGGSTGRRRKKRRAPLPPSFMYQEQINENSENGPNNYRKSIDHDSKNPFYEEIDENRPIVNSKVRSETTKPKSAPNPFYDSISKPKGYVGSNPFYEDVILLKSSTNMEKKVEESSKTSTASKDGTYDSLKRKAPKPPIDLEIEKNNITLAKVTTTDVEKESLASITETPSATEGYEPVNKPQIENIQPIDKTGEENIPIRDNEHSEEKNIFDMDIDRQDENEIELLAHSSLSDGTFTITEGSQEAKSCDSDSKILTDFEELLDSNKMRSTDAEQVNQSNTYSEVITTATILEAVRLDSTENNDSDKSMDEKINNSDGKTLEESKLEVDISPTLECSVLGHSDSTIRKSDVDESILCSKFEPSDLKSIEHSTKDDEVTQSTIFQESDRNLLPKTNEVPGINFNSDFPESNFKSNSFSNEENQNVNNVSLNTTEETSGLESKKKSYIVINESDLVDIDLISNLDESVHKSIANEDDKIQIPKNEVQKHPSSSQDVASVNKNTDESFSITGKEPTKPHPDNLILENVKPIINNTGKISSDNVNMNENGRANSVFAVTKNQSLDMTNKLESLNISTNENNSKSNNDIKIISIEENSSNIDEKPKLETKKTSARTSLHISEDLPFIDNDSLNNYKYTTIDFGSKNSNKRKSLNIEASKTANSLLLSAVPPTPPFGSPPSTPPNTPPHSPPKTPHNSRPSSPKILCTLAASETHVANNDKNPLDNDDLQTKLKNLRKRISESDASEEHEDVALDEQPDRKSPILFATSETQNIIKKRISSVYYEIPEAPDIPPPLPSKPKNLKASELMRTPELPPKSAKLKSQSLPRVKNLERLNEFAKLPSDRQDSIHASCEDMSLSICSTIDSLVDDSNPLKPPRRRRRRTPLVSSPSPHSRRSELNVKSSTTNSKPPDFPSSNRGKGFDGGRTLSGSVPSSPVVTRNKMDLRVDKTRKSLPFLFCDCLDAKS